MKKLLSMLLAFTLLFSLAACGESAEPDPNAGLYEAESAKMMGITINIADVFEDGFSLELKNGGKAVFHYDGKDYNLKWTLDGETFHAEGGGAELDGTLAYGVMTLQNVLDSGMEITLICDDLVPQMLDGPGEIAEPERYEPVLDAFATLPVYDADQTMAMSSQVNGYGMDLIEDEVFYGRMFVKGSRYAQFLRIELQNDGHSIKPGAWTLLDDKAWPEYMTKRGDTLFYIRNEIGVGMELGVARVNTDGSDFRMLYEGKSNYLSIAGDRLYFTDSDAHLVSTDLDGGDMQTVLDRQVFYTYMLNEDWVIYQDDGDSESLHLYYLPDGIDLKLNDERSYSPILCGSELFYMTPDGEIDGAHHLSRIDLSNYEEVWDEALGCHVPAFTAEHSEKLTGGEYMINGEYLLPCNNAGGRALVAWDDMEDDAYVEYRRVYCFISADYEVEEILNPANLNIDDIMIHDRHTNYGYSLPWLS